MADPPDLTTALARYIGLGLIHEFSARGPGGLTAFEIYALFDPPEVWCGLAFFAVNAMIEEGLIICRGSRLWLRPYAPLLFIGDQACGLIVDHTRHASTKA